MNLFEEAYEFISAQKNLPFTEEVNAYDPSISYIAFDFGSKRYILKKQLAGDTAIYDTILFMSCQ